MSNLDFAGMFSTLYNASPNELSQMNARAHVAATLAGISAAANPYNPYTRGAAVLAAMTATAIQTANFAQDVNIDISC
jgi:hypothetical protein